MSETINHLRPLCVYLYFRFSQKHTLSPILDQSSCLKDIPFSTGTHKLRNRKKDPGGPGRMGVGVRSIRRE